MTVVDVVEDVVVDVAAIEAGAVADEVVVHPVAAHEEEPEEERRAEPKSSSSLTDTVVSSSLVAKKTCWSPRISARASPFTARSASLQKLLARKARTARKQRPRLNTAFGTHSDPSLPQVSWEVSTTFS